MAQLKTRPTRASVAGYLASRVVYIIADTPKQVARLARLGKHKIGKSCLYMRRLADVDVKVLEELIAESAAEARRRYPAP